MRMMNEPKVPAPICDWTFFSGFGVWLKCVCVGLGGVVLNNVCLNTYMYVNATKY